MNDAGKQLKQIIAKLVERREHLDQRIAALREAVRALGDDHGASTRSRAHKVDRQGPKRTLEFLLGRKRPASIRAVARALHASPEAVSQRLAKLAESGKVERVKRGVYRATQQQGDKS